jgi:ABC-type Fe3+ transport system permease subunit
MLVLSDQADTLRFWIEQIQQDGGKPGLWAVVTSQAAPILRPYVRSGQIEGMVAGEYGGSLYERIFQQPGLARLQWNTFQTGVLAAIILVLVGGILNYIGQLILRVRKQKTS